VGLEVDVGDRLILGDTDRLGVIESGVVVELVVIVVDTVRLMDIELLGVRDGERVRVRVGEVEGGTPIVPTKL
jgi:hypothetical protein